MKKRAWFRGLLKRLAITLIATRLAAIAHAQSPIPAPAGLVDWWLAEGNATDSVGSNDGTLQGTASFAPGEVGSGFTFDASGYISIPDSPSLDAFTTNITIEFWMNSKTLWNHVNLPTLVGNGSWGVSVAVYDGNITVTFNGAYPYPVWGNRLINDGQWHHVAATYDGSTIALYVDGTLDIAQSAPGALIRNNAPLQIGNSFVGMIDEVSLYGRVLSASEIAAIHNAGNAGKIAAPQPPWMLTQPASQSVIVGETSIFYALAGGSPPVTYQWFHGSNSISGATNAALTLTNVQASDDGKYYVVASGPHGSTNSSTATLTVTGPTPANCTPTPAGLVAWWRAEGDTSDIIASNNGNAGTVTFTNGEVGQAFSFDGSTSYISVPVSSNLDVGAGDGLTLECWIWPSQPGPIAEWETSTALGPMLWVQGQGILYGNLRDINSNDHVIQSAPGAINSNGWQHVAMTYDRSSGNSCLFVNGVQVTNASFGKIRPATYPPLSMYFGYRANWFYAGRGSRYGGMLDELGVYNRALGPSEIRAIYNAGNAGKCFGPVPPSIVTAPTNETVAAGGRASFSVAAAGYPALSYQWFNGSGSISGATDPVLNLDSVEIGDAGSYYVVVSNAYGLASSASATLTVTNPPPPPACTPVPSGLIDWWQAEGNATDFIGTNNGVLFGGLTFTNGEVGQGFWFNNTNQGVRVPASPSLSPGQSMNPLGPEQYASCTFECWINPTDVSQPHTIFDWNGLEFSIESGGSLTARLQHYITMNDQYFLVTDAVSAGPGLVVTNTFQHVAVVLIEQLNPNAPGGSSGAVYVYYDGVQVGSMSQPMPLGPSGDLHLGYSPTRGIDFAGTLDEASLYNTGLSSDQIAAVYNAGPGGKCAAVPHIVSQPSNEVVPPGGMAIFSVTMGAGQTYSYQWLFNGTNLPSVGTISTVARTGSNPGGPLATCVALDKSQNVFFYGYDFYAVTNMATNGTFRMVAGNGHLGYSGDGGPATNANIGTIKGIAVDGNSNLFIADSSYSTIRKVDANGIITTFAGNGTNGYSGDGGPAANAKLSTLSGPAQPFGVAVDAAGNVFIADSGNNVIRKVDTNGIITTFAGNGTSGFWGDGGPATNAWLKGPTGVAVDSMGNVFIADNGNARIREVDASGIISTIAGGGTNGGTDGVGDGGLATGAHFSNPVAVALDSSGNLFVADYTGDRIREVFAGSGIILTVAGNGLDAITSYNYCYCDGGAATNAELSHPLGVAADNAGNLFIADGWDATIRKVSGLPAYPPNYASFIVRNASSANVGSYSVVITALNTSLSVTSSVVTLTIALPPVISGVAQNADGSFGLNLVTTTNVSSRVYAATNLCAPVSWLPVYTNFNGGAWQFTDTNTSGMAWKYYRVSTP